MLQTRPQFQSVEEYIDHVAAATGTGSTPWWPDTIEELKAAIEHFPETAKNWLPSQAIIWQTPSLHFLIDPWKLRLIDAVRTDSEFRSRFAVEICREVRL